MSCAGTITTIAGAASRGFSGDDGFALSAAIALANLQNDCDPNRFEQTVHASVDQSGNLYFADSNNQRIRRITPQGIITTVAGSGDRPVTNRNCEPTGAVGDGDQARSARLFNPADVVASPNGTFVIADQQNNRIRQITPGGVISTIAGNGLHNFFAPGVPATASPMDWPSALVVDSKGAIYFAEMHSNRIGKIGGDNGKASDAALNTPMDVKVDSVGNVYIADS